MRKWPKTRWMIFLSEHWEQIKNQSGHKHTYTFKDTTLSSTQLSWDAQTHTHTRLQSHHVASGVPGLNRESNQSTWCHWCRCVRACKCVCVPECVCMHVCEFLWDRALWKLISVVSLRWLWEQPLIGHTHSHLNTHTHEHLSDRKILAVPWLGQIHGLLSWSSFAQVCRSSYKAGREKLQGYYILSHQIQGLTVGGRVGKGGRTNETVWTWCSLLEKYVFQVAVTKDQRNRLTFWKIHLFA